MLILKFLLIFQNLLYLLVVERLYNNPHTTTCLRNNYLFFNISQNGFLNDMQIIEKEYNLKISEYI